ncbi:MAG: hypothetical protein R3C01_09300 [Planctomycetaceae bacterium]
MSTSVMKGWINPIADSPSRRGTAYRVDGTVCDGEMLILRCCQIATV